MNNMFIIYGQNDFQKFYIMNTNPIIWTSDITQAKLYNKQYSAEYGILRDYDNYTSVNSQLENGSLKEVFVSIIDSNYNELGRVKIL